MADLKPILLQTKLHRPRLPNDLVTRQRLLEWLNHDIDNPLTLICAPAGFGKSTLVSEWLRRMHAEKAQAPATIPAAWLSLDENDSDLTLFLRYFIAAIRTIFEGACEETLALIQARQPAPEEVLYATVCNELEKLPGECILVLDDYHTIQGVAVHNLLAEMVRHWPRPLHMVLISRISPPIPLIGFRARGMLSEIRTRDLRFSPEETAAYLSQSQAALASQNALPLLEERFEGWPAGLHLAVLSLRSEGNQEAILAALSSENANITEYLIDEVLTHQHPAIHSFLLKTSILDRFCAGLCEAVAGEVDPAWNARTCLEWIERSEMFLITLDDRREWYRYHNLFQELLQQRVRAEMTPDQVNSLHLQASAWFEDHGLIDEALHHALAAGDLELVGRQMSEGLREALNREDRPTLEHWLRMLPEEMIQQRPELLMTRVWALQFLWRHDLQAQVLQRVEDLLDSALGTSLPAKDMQILRGQVLLPRAQRAYFNNQTTQAIDLCQQVLALMPPTWTFVRGGAMIYLGLSMQANGQALEAERLLLDEYESYSEKADVYALFILQTLCFIYFNTGQLERSRHLAQVLIQAATSRQMHLMKYWGEWFPGMVHYQRNELEAAAQHFTQIYKNRYTAQISPYRDAVAGLALIHQIKGESTEAWQVVESIRQFDLETRGSEDERTRSLSARLLLLQGNPGDAGQWADSFAAPPPDQALMWLEEPQVTRVRVLLSRGKQGDVNLAHQILEALVEITNRTHNIRYKIEILALRAVALDATGDSDEACSILKQAINLAQPGGFMRVFVDLGEPMQAILRRLEKQDQNVEFIQRILAAFSVDESSLVSGKSAAQPRHQAAPGASSLVEPLTPRELEVLNLLRGPLSIKEIALKLHISYATAKRHTINLYGKLGANQRWEAVAKAEELNILPAR